MIYLVDTDEGTKTTTISSMTATPRDGDVALSSAAFIATDTQEYALLKQGIIPKIAVCEKPADALGVQSSES